MNGQQQYLFSLLKEIRDICDANGITYYIGMGTLIGAVRNRGFLPWDDDLDVLMTYENWERFKEVCKTQLPENRFLGSADLHESYCHLLPRYVSRDTTAFHPSQSLNDDVAGEVIDIFVLDPIADGNKAYDGYIQDIYLYSSLVNYANVAGTRFEIDPERYKRYQERVHAEGRQPVIRECEKLIASHFDEAGSRYAFRWQGAPVCFDRAWFGEGKLIEFEGELFTAPKDVNGLLTGYYGEEWPYVPLRINPAKHNTGASLNFPYTEALEYYHPTYNREKLLAETEERRYIGLTNAPLNNRLKDERARARAVVAALEVMKKVEYNRAEFEKALQDKDCETLSELLTDYIGCQVSTGLIGRHTNKDMYRYVHPVLVPVDDDVFEAALHVLLATSAIHHASRLLEVRAELGKSISDDMADVRAAITAYREAAAKFHSQQVDEGIEGIDDLVARYPYVPGFLRLSCAYHWKAYELRQDAESLDAAKRVIDAGLQKFPDDGFFQKYRADWLSATGADPDEVLDCYIEAAEHTRHGLELQDIADKTGYWPIWMRLPQWAKAYGMPEWVDPRSKDAEELEQDESPEGSEESIASTESEAAKPEEPEVDEEAARIASEDGLFQLLKEVVTLCDDLEIRHVLHPATTRALVMQKELPVFPEDVGIVCDPSDMERVIRALEGLAKHRGDRLAVHLGNDASCGDRAVRWYNTESLFLDLMAGDARTRNSLYVVIWPLEPEEYSDELVAQLQQYQEEAACEQQDAPTERSAQNGIAKFAERLTRMRGDKAGKAGKAEKAGKADEAGKADKADKAGMKLYCSLMAYAGESQGACIQLNGKTVFLGRAYLPKAQPIDCFGFEFLVPNSYRKRMRRLGMRPVVTQAEETVLASTSVTYDELVSCYGFDSRYYERKREAAIANKPDKAVFTKFRRNFSQVKLAVQLKELSLQLLPMKSEILALEEADEQEQLREILQPYFKCAKKYASIGDVVFDEDIYRVLAKTYNL